MPRKLYITTKSLAPYRVRFYREVATHLAKTGWEVTLVTAMAGAKDHPWIHLGDTDSSLRIIETGGAIAQTTLARCLGLFKKLPSDLAIPNLKLFRLLELGRPDVVWTHEYSPFCLGAALWASFRDRHSILSTDLGDHPPPYACSASGLRFHRLVSFLYEGVISQTAQATRRSHPAGVPILFAPHAIDTDEYRPRVISSRGRFRFLFTGALDDRKGIKQVIEAAKNLAKEGRNFELRILGSGPLAQWLSEQKDPWISVGGFVEGEKLREEYRSANAYVLPTSGDTYAVTVHEAAASGLPLIVGKAAGAVETLVKEGLTGHSIDPKNLDELAMRMREFLEDPEKAGAMGMAAREMAQRYDVKILGQRTAEFVADIANDPCTPRTAPLPGHTTRMTPSTKVAAIFATMNRRETACECVRLLAAQDEPPGKIFIADNASTDGTADALEKVAERVSISTTVIRLSQNLGNAGGIQLAMDQAFAEKFDYVWILDDDSWPEQSALSALLAADGPPEGIRTSLVLEPGSENVSWPCEVRERNGDWKMVNTIPDLSLAWQEIRRSWLGALIPKTAYQKVGQVNAELFLRGEDEEYPRRLEKAKYRFWLAPSSILRHPIAGPLVTLSVGDYKLCLERNLTADKLYYRIRNMLWIKRHESGLAAATVLACGYFLILTRWFRPLGGTLRVFGEAFRDALAGRLGKRPMV